MGTIIAGSGGALAYSAASGGKTYAFNTISTTPTANVAPVNPGRQKITFHNPGDVDILVAPMFIQNTGSNVALVPSPSARGGCYLVYANGGTLTLTGECQNAWQALSVSASGKPLTVTDSNT